MKKVAERRGTGVVPPSSPPLSSPFSLTFLASLSHPSLFAPATHATVTGIVLSTVVCIVCAPFIGWEGIVLVLILNYNRSGYFQPLFSHSIFEHMTNAPS